MTNRDEFKYMTPGDSFKTSGIPAVFLGYLNCNFIGTSGVCQKCPGKIKYALERSRTKHKSFCSTRSNGTMMSIDIDPKILFSNKILNDDLFEI